MGASEISGIFPALVRRRHRQFGSRNVRSFSTLAGRMDSEPLIGPVFHRIPGQEVPLPPAIPFHSIDRANGPGTCCVCYRPSGVKARAIS